MKYLTYIANVKVTEVSISFDRQYYRQDNTPILHPISKLEHIEGERALATLLNELSSKRQIIRPYCTK